MLLKILWFFLSTSIFNHLGTPIEAYNQEGELIWEREQDLYGNSRQGFAKENFRCPFKYQGQYYDSEVELCYNRFRYYHPEMGRYISEDPIKLLGGFNVFAYVGDTNASMDILGLYTVYRRKRNEKRRENHSPYVGSAVDGVDKRYGRKGSGDDIFHIPNKKNGKNNTEEAKDIGRGVEQLVYERGIELYGKDYWDNKNNPVSPEHKKSKQTYKDGKDKYTYRTEKGKEYLGENWKEKIDREFFEII